LGAKQSQLEGDGSCQQKIKEVFEQLFCGIFKDCLVLRLKLFFKYFLLKKYIFLFFKNYF
jgi:hypothetical protein